MASFVEFLDLGRSLSLEGSDLIEFATNRCKDLFDRDKRDLGRQAEKEIQQIKAKTEKLRRDIEKLDAITAEKDRVKFLEKANLYFRLQNEQLDIERVRNEQNIELDLAYEQHFKLKTELAIAKMERNKTVALNKSELKISHKQQQFKSDNEIETARVEITDPNKAESKKSEEENHIPNQDQSNGLDRLQVPVLTANDCLHPLVDKLQESMVSPQIPEMQSVACFGDVLTGTVLNTLTNMPLDDRASIPTVCQELLVSQKLTEDNNVGKVVSVPTPDKTEKHEGALVLQCDSYPEFIPHNSSIPSVLSEVSESTQKLKPREIFWDESCAHALNQIRKTFDIKPCVKLKILSPDFSVSPDASDVSVVMGAFIPQLQDETLHQFLKASRKLTDTQTHYSVSGKRKAVAIYCFIAVFFTDLFCRYLFGKNRQVTCKLQQKDMYRRPRFFVGLYFSRHSSGRHLFNNHRLRVTCWVQRKDMYRMGGILYWTLFLQAFHYQVIYRSAKQNVLADNLSRFPCTS